MKIKYYILAILFGLAVFFSTRKEQPKMAKLIRERSSQASRELTRITSEDIRKDLLKHNEKMASIRKKATDERAAGLTTYTLPENEQGLLSLEVLFSPKVTWCREGDLDHIEAFKNKYKDKNIQINIEEMGAVEPVIVSKNFDIEIAKNGQSLTFSLNKPSSNRLYFLYICSSDFLGDSCQGKPYADFSQLSEKISSANQIFYSQSFYLINNQIKLPSAFLNRDDSQYFSGLMAMTQRDQQDGLKVMEESAKSLGSLPFRYADERFLIPMPHQDHRCKEI